jgi:hypothetical protein
MPRRDILELAAQAVDEILEHRLKAVEESAAEPADQLAVPPSVAPPEPQGPGRPRQPDGQGRPEQVAQYHAKYGADATLKKFNFTPAALASNLSRARKARAAAARMPWLREDHRNN